MLSERNQLVLLIQKAIQQGARTALACQEAEIDLRTYRRWFSKSQGVTGDKRPDTQRPVPSNKLTEIERKEIIAVCNQKEYANIPPSQIVPRLADEGVYLASESTFYRVLKACEQLQYRGKAKAPERRKLPTTHIATGPKQLWSWDITYLPSTVKGQYFYLYLFVDIFSRKIVGHEVYEKESGEYASNLLQRVVFKEQCFHIPIVLHSDNGAPMKSLTLKAKMEELGVFASYSRPRVSNDNPYSEALFRTLKYCPKWPSEGFKSIEDARAWVDSFVEWYNTIHRHSQIGFVTPQQKHQGQDIELMEKRKSVYEAAKQRNPKRWSGNTRNWEAVDVVTLNPEKKEVIDALKVA